ncbi:MAG: hypothetical protein ACK52J_00920 [bacterium]
MLVLHSDYDGFFYDKLVEMLGGNYPMMTFKSSMSEFMKIIEYEICINHMVA